MFWDKYYISRCKLTNVATLIQETAILLVTFIVNVLFGYWRAATRKLTAEWFASVHLPIPIVYSLRILYAVPITHIPLFIVGYFLGQFSGGKIRKRLELKMSPTRCLIADLMRL